MSKVSTVGGGGADRVADAAGENECAVAKDEGHIENRAFYGPNGEGATNENGVARVNFVKVDENGKVDPSVKFKPGKKDGPKTPEDLMKLPGDDLLRQFREGDENLFKALQGSNGPTILMKIQTALSDESRMFSMLSNLQATDHETKKSIINNLRA